MSENYKNLTAALCTGHSLHLVTVDHERELQNPNSSTVHWSFATLGNS